MTVSGHSTNAMLQHYDILANEERRREFAKKQEAGRAARLGSADIISYSCTSIGACGKLTGQLKCCTIIYLSAAPGWRNWQTHGT